MSQHRPALAPTPDELPLSGSDRSERVRDMFAQIVPRYDVMNRLMTGGQDVYWRRLTARAVRPANQFALDIATGTGDLAIELQRQGARSVVAADYCEPMLTAAARKLRHGRITDVRLAVADACALPFPSATFDCLTSAFLLRNVVDLAGCLQEMRRVLRPGGRVAALELTPLPSTGFARLVRLYCRFLIPRIGAWVSGDARAYRYLPASVDPFPPADRLAQLFVAAGFEQVHYRRLAFGTVAIHRGVAPG